MRIILDKIQFTKGLNVITTKERLIQVSIKFTLKNIEVKEGSGLV